MGCGDVTVPGPMASFDAESILTPRKSSRRVYLRAHLAGVFPHAAGEDECVETADRRCHRGDLACQAMEVDVECKNRVRVASLAARHDVADVAGAAGESDEARTFLEPAVDLIESPVGVGDQPEHKPRVDRTGATGHDEAVEGREPHRRVE